MSPHRRALPLALLLALCAGGVACGKKGPPRPPEPRGPLPPKGVGARQLGDRAVVTFTVPRPRGEKNSQQPVHAELVRVEFPPGATPPKDAAIFRLRGAVVASREGDPLQPDRRLDIEDATIAALKDRGVGWTLRYGVRVRDRHGRPSPLVVAPDLVPVAPRAAPGGLTAEATADGIRISWTAPADSASSKYNLYRSQGEAPYPDHPLQVEPLTTNDYLDAAVVLGTSYRYVVRTIAADGSPPRESESSEEVRVVAEDRFAAAAPTGLVAVQEGRAVRLFWNPGKEKDLLGYRLYRKVGDSEWQRHGPDTIVEPTFVDEDVHAKDKITYRVTAIDRATPPNESDPSTEVALLVVEDPASGGEKP